MVLNRLFLGNPGTGKTTFAKFYGKLLKEVSTKSEDAFSLTVCAKICSKIYIKGMRLTDGCLAQVILLNIK
jgi:Cdc6-like AAA superfamily ATPase